MAEKRKTTETEGMAGTAKLGGNQFYEDLRHWLSCSSPPKISSSAFMNGGALSTCK